LPKPSTAGLRGEATTEELDRAHQGGSAEEGPGVGHAHHAVEDHARDPLAEGADRGQGTGDRGAGETSSRDREVAEEGRDPNLRIEEDLMKSPKAAPGPNQSLNPGPSLHPDQGQEASLGPDQTKHSEAILIDLYHTMLLSCVSCPE